MNTSQRLGMAIVVASGISALGAFPAFADEIYNYIGSNFTTATSPYTTSDSLHISLTFAAPLPADLPLTVMSAQSITITDGVKTYTNPDISLGFGNVDLSTNNNGGIAEWLITILFNDGITIQSLNAPPNITQTTDAVEILNSFPTPNTILADNIIDPGTWTFTESVPGPIPGAGIPGLVFACGGLLVWWRIRRPCRIA